MGADQRESNNFLLLLLPKEVHSVVYSHLQAKTLACLWITGDRALRESLEGRYMVSKVTHEIAVPQDIYFPTIIEKLDGIVELNISWRLSGFYRTLPLLELRMLPSSLTALRLSFPQGLCALSRYIQAQLPSNPQFNMSTAFPLLEVLHLPLVNGISYTESLEQLCIVFFRLPSTLLELSFDSCLDTCFSKEPSKASTPLNRIFQPGIEDSWNRSQAQFPPHLTRIALSCDSYVLSKLPSSVLHLKAMGGLASFHLEELSQVTPDLLSLHVELSDSELPYLMTLLPPSLTSIQLEGRYLAGPRAQPLNLERFPNLQALILSTDLISQTHRLRTPQYGISRFDCMPRTLTRLNSDVELFDAFSTFSHLPDLKELSYVLHEKQEGEKSIPTRDLGPTKKDVPSRLESLKLCLSISQSLIDLLPITLTELTAGFDMIIPTSGIRALRLLSNLRTLHASTRADNYDNRDELIDFVGMISDKAATSRQGLELRFPRILQFLPPSVTDVHLVLPYLSSGENVAWCMDFVTKASELDTMTTRKAENTDSEQHSTVEDSSTRTSNPHWHLLKSFTVSLCLPDLYPIRSLGRTHDHESTLMPVHILHGALPPNLTTLSLPQLSLHLYSRITSHLRTLVVGQFENRSLDSIVNFLPPRSLTFLSVAINSSPYEAHLHTISIPALGRLPKTLCRIEFYRIDFELPSPSEVEMLALSIDSISFPSTARFEVQLQVPQLTYSAIPSLSTFLSWMFNCKREWVSN